MTALDKAFIDGPQVKNLALPAIYQTEILRLSPQDDTEIPDDAGRKEVWLQLLERFKRLELQFQSVRMLI